MIPALTQFLHGRQPESAGKRLTLIKWNNGVGYRNPKVSFVAFCDGRPFLFLKTVRFARDNDVIRRAHERIQAANRIANAVSPACPLPIPVWMEEVSGYAVSAESVVPGSPIRIDQAEQVRHVLDWLHGFSAASPVSFVDSGSVRSAGWRALEEIRAGEDARKVFGEALEAQLARWRDPMIPITPAHGDFTPFNTLTDATGRIGVIDWDGYGTIETPLFDLLTFIDRVTPKGGNPYERYRRDLDRALAGLKADPSLLPLAVLLYVLMTDWRKRVHAAVDGNTWDRRLLASLEMQMRRLQDAGLA